jgi:hypothetical protein
MPVPPLCNQVEGPHGLKVLLHKVGHHGPGVLYHGALASAAATLVGHFPWFTTVRGAGWEWGQGDCSLHTEVGDGGRCVEVLSMGVLGVCSSVPR